MAAMNASTRSAPTQSSNSASNSASSPTRFHPLHAWIVYGLLVTAALLVVVWSLSEERQRVLVEAERQVRSLSETAATHALRMFESSDAALRQAAEHFANRDLSTIADSEADWHYLGALADDVLSTNPPQMRYLVLTDARGRLVLHGRYFPAPLVSFADRAYFRRQAEGSVSGFFVDKPLTSRTTGGLVVPMSRALQDGQGRFKGVVALTTTPQGLGEALVAAVSVEGQGRAVLFSTDGLLLAQYPNPESVFIGQEVECPEIRAAVARGETQGLFHARCRGSDTTLLMAFSKVGRLPLYTAMALDENMVLADWRWGAARAIMLALLLFLGIGILIALLLRHIRAAVAAHDLLVATFEAVGTGLCMIDAGGRMRRINRSFAALCGRDGPDLLGRKLIDLLPTEERLAPDKAQQTLMEGLVTGSADWRIQQPDGAVRDVLLTGGQPVETAEGHFAMYALTDVGERKILERNLRAAYEEAAKASRAKSAFLAMMSHELRTPMNGLLGIGRMLLDDDATPRQRDYLEMLYSSSQTLLTALSDILDLSKLEEGSIVLQTAPFALRALLDELVAQETPLAVDQGLSLSVEMAADVPAYVEGDAHRLRQMLLNLLGNVVKFTRHGGVQLRVTSLGSRPDGRTDLRFSIRDIGNGIPADIRDRLFRPFLNSGIQPHYDTSGGIGLGLVIARRLAEAMGGTIRCDSHGGHGNLFTVVISLHPAPALPEVATSVTESLPTLKVLVAEDMKVNQVVIKALLDRVGHMVTLVPDGAEAVAAVMAGDFDVVLMDIQMPVMDGLEALRRIRDLPDPRKARIPVLAMTANVLEGDIARYQAAGMSAVLVKPLDPARLHASLATLLGGRLLAGREAVAPVPALAVKPETTTETLATTETLMGADAAVAACSGSVDVLPLFDPLPAEQMLEVLSRERVIALYERAEASLSESMAGVLAAWRVENWDERAAHAHKLAGTAGTYGCMALMQRARALEAEADQKPPVDKPPADDSAKAARYVAQHTADIEALEALWYSTLAAQRRYIAGLARASATTIDSG